jgi:transposase
VEIITGEPRKRRSDDEKRAILAEALATGNVTRTARRHGVNPSMVFAWRKTFGAAQVSCGVIPAPSFMPVLTDETQLSPEGAALDRTVIEIVCGSIRIDIRAGADAALAAAVAKVLTQT